MDYVSGIKSKISKIKKLKSCTAASCASGLQSRAQLRDVHQGCRVGSKMFDSDSQPTKFFDFDSLT